MPVLVFRCSHCRREVLVRALNAEGEAPLSEAEIARRIEEEMRATPRGPFARPDMAMRLRDDIWVAIAGTRDYVPRHELPDRCPACLRAGTLIEARPLEG